METANQIDWKENWKNSSLLFKSKSLLNKESSLSLYFSYIHRYAIVAWASTYMTNLKKKNSQQKHALCIIFNKGKCEHTRHLFKLNEILNVYQPNILNNLIFM